MVDTRELVIGYILTFIGVYLFTLMGSMVLNEVSDSQIDLIGTQNITQSVSAISYGGFNLFWIGCIIIIAFAIVLVMSGMFRTFGAF